MASTPPPQHPVPQDVALIKAKFYIRKKWKKEPRELAPLHRSVCIYTLHTKHGVDFPVLADMFGVTTRTVKEDINRMQFFVSINNNNLRKWVDDMERYIIYIANYIV